MIPRRVVTNINTIGKAILQSDGVPPWSKEMVHTPGFASSFIWATSPAPKIPTSGDDPTDTATSIVPGPGETRFLVVTFPPDLVFADPAIDFAKANQEQAEEFAWSRRIIRARSSGCAHNAHDRLWHRTRRRNLARTRRRQDHSFERT